MVFYMRTSQSTATYKLTVASYLGSQVAATACYRPVNKADELFLSFFSTALISFNL